MANLRDIKRRIGSVKSTQKITKAMKMVAASKLRRAQDAIVRARPYAFHMRDLVNRVADRAEANAHPLLRAARGGKVALVVITADRGLCGAFNAAIVMRTLAAIREDFAGREVELVVVGRKGVDLLKRRQLPIRRSLTGVFDAPVMDAATTIIDDLVGDYLRGGTDEVFTIYNEFKSAVQQRVVLERLLPFALEAAPEAEEGAQEVSARPLDYLYEPGREELFEGLLLRSLRVQMHRILFESAASEYGARMTAMDNASRNAGEVIERLTLKYNRARQDAITTELIEVISGAEAL
jgi:F-type H+-transporting ATPase subunit gamma